MKKIVLLLCVVSILSCKEESKEYALISGKIENVSTTEAIVTDGTFEKQITIASDGSFSDTLNIKKAKFYNFAMGNSFAKFYVAKGDKISVFTSAKNFNDSLKFIGDNAFENNYLQAKAKVDFRSQKGAQEIYSLDETAFKNKLDEIASTNLQALNAIVDADENFVKFEKENIKYEKFGVYSDYQNAHSYFTRKEDFKVSEDFMPEELDKPFENSELYEMSSAYRELALNSNIDAVFENLGMDRNVKPENVKVLEDIKIVKLKDDVINFVGTMLLSPSNKHMKELYTFFEKNTKDAKVKSNIAEAYEKNKKLLTGMPSPKFVNYENNTGGTTSLDDLKGKYVYIDVWATWCGPCIAEIPSLKKTEEKYEGKNVEFVSVSIDTPNDYDKWKKMIEAKELGGTQVLADNNWQSQFVKDYAIDGIPRFILLDPEGNIVSADAPRPSNPDLITLLDEELSK